MTASQLKRHWKAEFVDLQKWHDVRKQAPGHYGRDFPRQVDLLEGLEESRNRWRLSFTCTTFLFFRPRSCRLDVLDVAASVGMVTRSVGLGLRLRRLLRGLVLGGLLRMVCCHSYSSGINSDSAGISCATSSSHFLRSFLSISSGGMRKTAPYRFCADS